MSGVFAADGRVDDGIHAVAGDLGDTQMIHQFLIADRNRNAVYSCDDTVAADCLNDADVGTVDLLAIGSLESLAGGREARSASAAYSIGFSSLRSRWWMLLTWKTPWISVPVLSKTGVLT